MKSIKGILNLKNRKPYAQSTHMCLDNTFEVYTYDFKLSRWSRNDKLVIYPLIDGEIISNFEDIFTHFFYCERFCDQGVLISVEKGFDPDFCIEIIKE